MLQRFVTMWLKTKYLLRAICLIFSITVSVHSLKGQASRLDPIELSQELLLAARQQEPADSLMLHMKSLTQDELSLLKSDEQKLAFWINVYNAYTQLLLRSDQTAYTRRSQFFGKKQIVVAGKNLSLDDIEHDLLRHSTHKWSLGYLQKWIVPAFEKLNRVEKTDYRIHFTLNCGAKSCPPIGYYKPEQLTKQMNLATLVYLNGECEYSSDSTRIYLPAFMGWFRGDFGGKKGMRKILVENKINISTKTKIRFKRYDWNLYLDNYTTE
jgi:hypothetical protein